MDFLYWSAVCVTVVAFLLITFPISARYMQFFQQEEYDNRRFLAWLKRTRSYDQRTFFLAFLSGFMLFGVQTIRDEYTSFSVYLFMYVAGLFALAVSAWAHVLKAESKKPLVYTTRVKRIIGVTLTLHLLLIVIFLSLLAPSLPLFPIHGHWLVSFIMVMIMLIPYTIVLANLLLSPYEARIQQKFLHEARQKLTEVKPEIIGITGSYGKTSIKHILAHILDSHAPTLATPGSVNTQMGITRIIREKLKREHQYFIVEMGAYGIGSIQRLCDLTPPNAALVTAVGVAHYERFKSLETVTQAKSELPRAVPPHGFAVLNGDDSNCRAMAEQISCPAFLYGQNRDHHLDCALLSAETTDQGTSCVFELQGQQHSVIMPIYGTHQALNAAGAFLTAVKLGVPVINILAALQTVPQITHRLVVERGDDGITFIDDAYNSNPAGFQSALDVLSKLRGLRKILITPGMVELGERHDDEHRIIARRAAEVCDVILLVAPERIEAFCQGLLENHFPQDHIHRFASLHEARKWLNQNIRAQDVVLFENDLPDLYEEPRAFRIL
jgi:UDP-N-acetylmuramoyl-tripeptide--D-alanyl-D-alanine ligase